MRSKIVSCHCTTFLKNGLAHWTEIPSENGHLRWKVSSASLESLLPSDGREKADVSSNDSGRYIFNYSWKNSFKLYPDTCHWTPHDSPDSAKTDWPLYSYAFLTSTLCKSQHDGTAGRLHTALCRGHEQCVPARRTGAKKKGTSTGKTIFFHSYRTQRHSTKLC